MCGEEFAGKKKGGSLQRVCGVGYVAAGNVIGARSEGRAEGGYVEELMALDHSDRKKSGHYAISLASSSFFRKSVTS